MYYILTIQALAAPLLCAVGGSNGELRVFKKLPSGFIEIFHHNQFNPNGMSSKYVCCVHLAAWEKKTASRRGSQESKPSNDAPTTATTRSGMLARMRTARSGSNLNTQIAASGEGYLAVGSRSGVVECWDVSSQECIFSTSLGHAEGHSGRVNSLTVLLDESGKLPPLLFSGGNDMAARLYDFKSKRCCLVIKSSGGPVTCVSGGSGNLASRLLYVASADGVIRCFAFKNGDMVRLVRVFRGHSDRIMSMEVANVNNEDVLRTCSRDGTLRIWETGYEHRSEDDTESKSGHIVGSNIPMEASIILRPAKVPFMAINAFTSSMARFISKSKDSGRKPSVGTPPGVAVSRVSENENRCLFMAAGMSDGSMCVWKSNL